MRRVEVLVELREGATGGGGADGAWGNVRARQVMVDCRRVMLEWYGRLDLMGRERWSVEPVVEWEEGEGEEGWGSGGARLSREERKTAKSWVAMGSFDLD